MRFNFNKVDMQNFGKLELAFVVWFKPVSGNGKTNPKIVKHSCYISKGFSQNNFLAESRISIIFDSKI